MVSYLNGATTFTSHAICDFFIENHTPCGGSCTTTGWSCDGIGYRAPSAGNLTSCVTAGGTFNPYQTNMPGYYSFEANWNSRAPTCYGPKQGTIAYFCNSVIDTDTSSFTLILYDCRSTGLYSHGTVGNLTAGAKKFVIDSRATTPSNTTTWDLNDFFYLDSACSSGTTNDLAFDTCIAESVSGTPCTAMTFTFDGTSDQFTVDFTNCATYSSGDIRIKCTTSGVDIISSSFTMIVKNCDIFESNSVGVTSPVADHHFLMMNNTNDTLNNPITIGRTTEYWDLANYYSIDADCSFWPDLTCNFETDSTACDEISWPQNDNATGDDSLVEFDYANCTGSVG